jgi:putative ABC transport system substrate-binding protein
VERKINLIVTIGLPATIAAARTTKSIPIVQASGGDVISSGLAASLSRPGGNVTGLINLAEDLGAKLLESLLTMVPKVTRVGILHDPKNPAAKTQLATVLKLAPPRQVMVFPAPVSEPNLLDDAFSELSRQKVDALIIVADAFLLSQRRRIVDFAANARLPASGSFRVLV